MAGSISTIQDGGKSSNVGRKVEGRSVYYMW